MILVVDRLTDFGFSVLGIILGASSRTEKPNPFNRSITIKYILDYLNYFRQLWRTSSLWHHSTYPKYSFEAQGFWMQRMWLQTSKIEYVERTLQDQSWFSKWSWTNTDFKQCDNNWRVWFWKLIAFIRIICPRRTKIEYKISGKLFRKKFFNPRRFCNGNRWSGTKSNYTSLVG